jgi:hypothetical protein
MAITLDPSENESASKDPKKKHGRRQGMPELIFGDLWVYDPAPETADPRIRQRYDLFTSECSRRRLRVHGRAACVPDGVARHAGP